MNHATRAVALLISLALPLIASAGQSLTIPKKAEFSRSNVAPVAVQAECQLPEKVSQSVKEYAGKEFDEVKMVDKVSAKTPGNALAMQIVEVQGVSGGAWTGPKAVVVEGKLYRNGKVAGSFKATRFSGGGAFGAYKNTCSILSRCTKAIGKDVAGWLKSPTMNAKLGDTK